MIHRKAIITTVASVLTIGIVSGAVALTGSTPQGSGADTSPVTTTLQQQQDELNNHEARITNTEGNIKTLGDKTGTNTTTVVEVPAPVTTQVTPVSTPVTVTDFAIIPVGDNGSMDCRLTYSDGTSYQWHWKVVTGNTTTTNSICSNLQIGNTKVN